MYSDGIETSMLNPSAMIPAAPPNTMEREQEVPAVIPAESSQPQFEVHLSSWKSMVENLHLPGQTGEYDIQYSEASTSAPEIPVLVDEEPEDLDNDIIFDTLNESASINTKQKLNSSFLASQATTSPQANIPGLTRISTEMRQKSKSCSKITERTTRKPLRAVLSGDWNSSDELFRSGEVLLPPPDNLLSSRGFSRDVYEAKIQNPVRL